MKTQPTFAVCLQHLPYWRSLKESNVPEHAEYLSVLENFDNSFNLLRKRVLQQVGHLSSKEVMMGLPTDEKIKPLLLYLKTITIIAQALSIDIGFAHGKIETTDLSKLTEASLKISIPLHTLR